MYPIIVPVTNSNSSLTTNQMGLMMMIVVSWMVGCVLFILLWAWLYDKIRDYSDNIFIAVFAPLFVYIFLTGLLLYKLG